VSARGPGAGDASWWTGHLLVAVFGLLVAAILRAVPGWSAPLHAWIALTSLVIALLAVHAGSRAVACAIRRDTRAALLALLLAVGLGGSAAILIGHGHSHFDLSAAARAVFGFFAPGGCG
jgi:hypothetical protein